MYFKSIDDSSDFYSQFLVVSRFTILFQLLQVLYQFLCQVFYVFTGNEFLLIIHGLEKRSHWLYVRVSKAYCDCQLLKASHSNEILAEQKWFIEAVGGYLKILRLLAYLCAYWDDEGVGQNSLWFEFGVQFVPLGAFAVKHVEIGQVFVRLQVGDGDSNHMHVRIDTLQVLDDSVMLLIVDVLDLGKSALTLSGSQRPMGTISRI